MGIQGGIKGLRLRGTYNVEIRLEGNWVKYETLTRNMDILLVMATRSGQKAFAEEYRDKVKLNIRTGGKRFGYPQNSPEYLVRKGRGGGGSTALVWSSTFLRSVDIIKNTRGTHWGVGIAKGIKRPNYFASESNRLEVHEIANILENGAQPHVRARPVFADTFKYDMKGKKGLINMMELSIMKHFGTKGFRVNRI